MVTASSLSLVRTSANLAGSGNQATGGLLSTFNIGSGGLFTESILLWMAACLPSQTLAMAPAVSLLWNAAVRNATTVSFGATVGVASEPERVRTKTPTAPPTSTSAPTTTSAMTRPGLPRRGAGGW